jgi:hypothetical protein
MRHEKLERRVAVLESRLPTPEDEEKRRRDEFLSQCTDDELNRLIAITEKDEMSSDDITFLEELEAKYEAGWH